MTAASSSNCTSSYSACCIPTGTLSSSFSAPSSKKPATLAEQLPELFQKLSTLNNLPQSCQTFPQLVLAQPLSIPPPRNNSPVTVSLSCDSSNLTSPSSNSSRRSINDEIAFSEPLSPAVRSPTSGFSFSGPNSPNRLLPRPFTGRLSTRLSQLIISASATNTALYSLSSSSAKASALIIPRTTIPHRLLSATPLSNQSDRSNTGSTDLRFAPVPPQRTHLASTARSSLLTSSAHLSRTSALSKIFASVIPTATHGQLLPTPPPALQSSSQKSIHINSFTASAPTRPNLNLLPAASAFLTPSAASTSQSTASELSSNALSFAAARTHARVDPSCFSRASATVRHNNSMPLAQRVFHPPTNSSNTNFLPLIPTQFSTHSNSSPQLQMNEASSLSPLRPQPLSISPPLVPLSQSFD